MYSKKQSSNSHAMNRKQRQSTKHSPPLEEVKQELQMHQYQHHYAALQLTVEGAVAVAEERRHDLEDDPPPHIYLLANRYEEFEGMYHLELADGNTYSIPEAYIAKITTLPKPEARQRAFDVVQHAKRDLDGLTRIQWTARHPLAADSNSSGLTPPK